MVTHWPAIVGPFGVYPLEIGAAAAWDLLQALVSWNSRGYIHRKQQHQQHVGQDGAEMNLQNIGSELG